MRGSVIRTAIGIGAALIPFGALTEMTARAVGAYIFIKNIKRWRGEETEGERRKKGAAAAWGVILTVTGGGVMRAAAAVTGVCIIGRAVGRIIKRRREREGIRTELTEIAVGAALFLPLLGTAGKIIFKAAGIITAVEGGVKTAKKAGILKGKRS